MNMFERPVGFVPLAGSGGIGGFASLAAGAGIDAFGSQRPTRFVRDARFHSTDEPVDEASTSTHSSAWQTGYDEGLAEARTKVATEVEASQDASVALDRMLTLVDDHQAASLAERLRETVIALCYLVIDHAAIDHQALGDRIEAAVATLRRSDEERLLRLHPDDVALVTARFAPTLAIEPDPLLERGSIRIETATGGVESGPRQWRNAIGAAVRGC